MTEREFTKFTGHVSRCLLPGREFPDADMEALRANVMRFPLTQVREAFDTWLHTDPKAGEWKLYAKVPPFGTWRMYLDAAMGRVRTAPPEEGPRISGALQYNNQKLMMVIMAATATRRTAKQQGIDLPTPPAGLVRETAHIYRQRTETESDMTARDFAALFYPLWPEFAEAVMAEISGEVAA